MNRALAGFTATLVLLLVSPLTAGGDENVELRFFASREEAVWVGEKLEIYLELWTTDLSFSGQAFTLPEVRGGHLLQQDPAAVNLTERRGGATWQGLRYTFNLYLQRPGALEIPSFEVRFSTRSGYGSEARPHAFQAPALAVEARLPPGADSGGLLVTTASFSLDASWNPDPAGEDTIELQTGDALVLTVKRKAGGVPGMVFAPLPAFEFEGLGVYIDAPLVNDRAYRGDLTGSRTDRVTLVCERPGLYRLPELTFQWWDPVRERLEEEKVAPLRVEVTENPAWAVAPAPGERIEPGGIDWRWLWVLPAAVFLRWPVWPLVRGAAAWFRRELAAKRLEPLNPRSTRSSR